MIVRSQFKKWKWKFQRKQVFALPVNVGKRELTIESSTGNKLVVAKENKLTIKRHYHFDGATWAPDFNRVLAACALHDAMLQLADKYPLQINERMAHLAFKKQMREDGFLLWPVYYFAVASFPRKIYKVLST